MADADIDIYGDLCADLPGPKVLETVEAPKPGPPPATATPVVIDAEESGAGLGFRGAQSAAHSATSPREAPAAVVNVEEEWGAAPDEPPDWDWENDVDQGAAPATGQAHKERPQDFEALQRELMAEERLPLQREVSKASSARASHRSGGSTAAQGAQSAAAREEGSPTEEEECASEVSGEADDTIIQLGEVLASQIGPVPFTSPRRWSTKRPSTSDVAAVEAGGSTSKLRRKEVSVFMGPPPPAPASVNGGGAACLVLVGGLPWWLPDVELRRFAQEFGPLRSTRVLDHKRSGKSVGIALLEYTAAEAASRAASPTQGLRKLGAWAAMSAPAPRTVLVSAELFSRLQVGVPPWPDGGPCSDELRAILVRQFDASHSSQRAAAGRSQGGAASAPAVRGTRWRKAPSPPRAALTPVAEGRCENEASKQNQPAVTNWADKLLHLKKNVNRRSENRLGSQENGIDATKRARLQ